ncbi:MAG TPA: SRPBCC family protein [Microbacteriaceae bacterium]|nr:SRPBCC family protein [Microbacteriaceae bacterium]
MPVIEITQDPAALTLTVVAEFAAPLRRVWDAYLDPRELERFWGPPTYPATFLRHDAYPGGLSWYVMTGPEGDQHGGYWEWLRIDELRAFEVLDGFADLDGTPNREIPPMRMEIRFEEVDDGTRTVTTSQFASLEALEQQVAMGVIEGLRAAMSQIDEVLADLRTFAADQLTEAQLLSDTEIRVSRVIRGTVEQVWRAHHEPELMRQWLLGPEGWTMPVCDIATEVGHQYRYEWEQADGTGRFGFTGELLESAAPHRAVTTETMIGMDGPPTLNAMTLTPVDGGTLLVLRITYPSQELRDMVLGTGMTDGMETSYARLESLLT